VLWNGLRQHLRESTPLQYVGAAATLLVLAGIIWNILNPRSAGHGLARVLADSSMTWPPVVVRSLTSEWSVWAIIAAGCWTHFRIGRSPRQCGVEAIKLGVAAITPVVLLGALIFAGVIDLRIAGLEHAPLTGSRAAYTFYATEGRAPSALVILIAPFFRLPELWIWGYGGGQLGVWLRRRFGASLVRA
jgi:hypothetical protein